MSADTVFTIANNGILIFWLLLIVAPRWKGTDLLVHSMAVPVVIGLTYAWLIARAFLGEGAPGASFSSLAGVMSFFTSPVAATAGWIHYLVFDLFIGAWESRDAQRRGIPHWAVIPCLIVTLLFGPIGFLLYLILRMALGKGGFSLRETPA
ncbi:MAG: ABA4-like family protein [Rhizomicrobium sp.]